MRKRTKNRKRPTARWGAAGAALLAGVCLAVQTQAARRPAGTPRLPAPKAPAVQKQASDQVSLMDLQADEIREKLSAINVETLTPIEAMNILYQLKQLL